MKIKYINDWTNPYAYWNQITKFQTYYHPWFLPYDSLHGAGNSTDSPTPRFIPLYGIFHVLFSFILFDLLFSLEHYHQNLSNFSVFSATDYQQPPSFDLFHGKFRIAGASRFGPLCSTWWWFVLGDFRRRRAMGWCYWCLCVGNEA